MKCCPVTSTLYDLSRYKVDVTDARTHRRTDRQTNDRPTLVRNQYTLFFSIEKSGDNNENVASNMLKEYSISDVRV